VVFRIAMKGASEMVRGNPKSTRAWPARRLALPACLLALLASGCGGGMTPEHTAAILELQSLGARVNLKRGGYDVDLTNTTVEDKHLVHLAKITNLKTVDLRGTLVTDAGLEYLKPITTLEVVELGRTGVTPEGVASLKKALPNAAIRG
jgi:hypothetical protein